MLHLGAGHFIPVVWNLRTMNLSSVGKNLPCRGCEPLLSLFWGRICLCCSPPPLSECGTYLIHTGFPVTFGWFLRWRPVSSFCLRISPPLRIIPKYLKPVIASSLWAYWGQIPPSTASQSQVPLIEQLSKQYLMAHGLQGPHCLHLSLSFLSSAIPQRFQ